MKLKAVVDELKNMFTRDKKEAEAAESLQARILVSTLSYNDSMVIEDENGEFHKPPVPDPVDEELLVKKGDCVNGFEVLDLTANFLVLKSFLEYTTGTDSSPKTQFIIEKGDCIKLTMYGLYDAVHKTSISYIETVAAK